MSDKKLYRATFEGVLYFMATDDIDAENHIDDFIEKEAAESRSCSTNIEEVENDAIFDSSNDEDWLDSIPWGSDDDRTVRQILEAMA